MNFEFQSCAYNDVDEEGLCMPFYNCVNGVMVTTPNNPYTFNGTVPIINYKMFRKCPGDLLCCPKSMKYRANAIPPESMPADPEWKNCGHRNSGVRVKHVNVPGKHTVAQFGEFPWTIAFFETFENNGTTNATYQFAGSLIHPRIVLSTAHNFLKKNLSHMFARAGEWDLSTENEILPHQDRNIVDIKTYEFDYAIGANDISLVVLEKEFTISEHIRTVCLARTGQSFIDECKLIGWGKDSFNDMHLSHLAKKVTLTTVELEECQKKLRRSALGPAFMLDPSQICASGNEVEDSCPGDGGAALVCPEDDVFYQYGITSWGIGCANQYPGVYTKIPYFRSWIDLEFRRNEWDNSYYVNSLEYD